MIDTCRLCLTANSELQDSHIQPKWAYRRIRQSSDGHPNPNPVHFRDGSATQTSRQLTQHLLCRQCEQRFSAREAYVASVVYQVDGSAPMFARLTPLPAETRPPWRLAEPLGLDLEQIAYFAASVFWRAHVCADLASYSLGPNHAEAVRQYLLGNTPFPQQGSMVLLLDEDSPGAGCEIANLFTMPISQRAHGHYIHTFALFGLHPMLVVGALVPDAFKKFCIIRGDTPRAFIQAPTQSPFGFAMADAVKRSGPIRSRRGPRG